MLDVCLGRSHPGAEQPIIRFPEPSANFPAHVHLDQRKLLQILLVDLVEGGGGYMNCRAIFDCADGGAAWPEVHYRHLSEAVALLQD